MDREMSLYFLAIGVLAVWRITHLFNAEDGPWDMVVRLRRMVGPGVIGQAMDCFYCLSLWVSLPVALLIGSHWLERALLWPAISGAAILLERLTDRTLVPPVTYHEDFGTSPTPETLNQEDQHAVLR
jgi:hypothetical protein